MDPEGNVPSQGRRFIEESSAHETFKPKGGEHSKDIDIIA